MAVMKVVGIDGSAPGATAVRAARARVEQLGGNLASQALGSTSRRSGFVRGSRRSRMPRRGVTMKVRDLMTTDPLTVSADTLLKDAARAMVRNRVSGLPVIGDGALIGIVTEGDFLRQEANRDQPYRFSLLDALFGEGPADPPAVETVAEVMTEDVITIRPEATIGQAARVMVNQQVKRLPVIDEDGTLIGIISRADVVNAFTKPDEIIEDEVREDIIRRLLFLDPEEVGVSVEDGVVTLEGEMENRTEAHLLEELTRRVEGVVRVDSQLTFLVDDQKAGRHYPLNN